jgi:cytosine/adenosine deaminase-related metal-dependent hydrolase
MFAQMRSAFRFQRLSASHSGPGPIDVRDVLEFATVEGAKACGLFEKCGTLTPGKQADITLLRADALNVAPISDTVGAIVTAMDTRNVDTVIIAGVVRKRSGRVIGVDVERLIQRATASRDGVLARAGLPPIVR